VRGGGGVLIRNQQETTCVCYSIFNHFSEEKGFFFDLALHVLISAICHHESAEIRLENVLTSKYVDGTGI
jgi:hypothetical protein